MNNKNASNPAHATRLGLPIAPIDFDAHDVKQPAIFLASIETQMTAARMRYLQFHFESGDIYQFDIKHRESRDELVWLLEQLVHANDRFYLVAIPQQMEFESIPNVWDEIHSDTLRAQSCPGFKTKMAGVHEMSVAIGCGCAAEMLDLSYHTHRRAEIADIVAQILKVPADRYPEASRIQAAGVAVLRVIDRLVAARSELDAA